MERRVWRGRRAEGSNKRERGGAPVGCVHGSQFPGEAQSAWQWLMVAHVGIRASYYCVMGAQDFALQLHEIAAPLLLAVQSYNRHLRRHGEPA